MNPARYAPLAWKIVLTAALCGFVALAAASVLHLPSYSDPIRQLNYALNLGQFVISIPLAIALGWRSASSTAMRILSLILIASSLPWLITVLPAGVTRVRIDYLVPFILVFIYTGFLFLTLQFPSAEPLLRRPAVRRAFIIFAAVFVANGALEVTDMWGRVGGRLELVFSACAVCASLGALWRAWHLATGIERQRIGWVAMSLGSIYITFAVYVITRLAGYEIAFTPLANWLDAVQLASIVILAFAMLRYRVFDLGFAINRTLVFSLTSLVLILVFFLAERAVHGLLHFEPGRTSAWVDGTLAFTLFFFFNKLHHRVDHWVEQMFFHSWHANADALSRFIRKSAHFTDASDLCGALSRELVRFTHGAGNAIYLANPDGGLLLATSSFSDAPPSLGANDDMVVDVRASLKSHYLDPGVWQPDGELVFPIMQGVKLKGLVIVGKKPRGDSSRPDEVQALASAISEVGLILFALKVDRLEARNRELDALVGQNEHIHGEVLRELKLIRALVRSGAPAGGGGS